MSRKMSHSVSLPTTSSEYDGADREEDPITALMNASGGGFNMNNTTSVLDRFRLTPPLPSNPNLSTDLTTLQRPAPHSNKMVCGAQYRMPQRAHHCDNCDVLSASAKKYKETIRSLKLQIGRLEEQLAFQSSKSGKLPPPQFSNHDNSSEEINSLKAGLANLNKKFKESEAEVARLKKQISDDQNAFEDHRRASARTIQVTNQELAMTRDEYMKLDEHHKDLKIKSKELRSTVKVLEEKNQNLEDEISKLRNELNDQQSHQESSSTAVQEELTKLRIENSNLSEQVSALKHQLQKQTEEASDKENALQLEIDKLRAELMSESENVAQRDTIIVEKERIIEVLKSKVAEIEPIVQSTKAELAKMINEKNSAQLNAKTLTAEKKELVDANNELNNKYNDLCLKMVQEAELTAKALEKAISSSVRLCVVAPTVNVHISDKKMRFQSKTSETELRSFLEQNVLNKFVYLYKQEHDDTAPDGKTPLRQWVTRMLSEMQESIESHINNAMKGGKPSEGSDSGKEDQPRSRRNSGK